MLARLTELYSALYLVCSVLTLQRVRAVRSVAILSLLAHAIYHDTVLVHRINAGNVTEWGQVTHWVGERGTSVSFTPDILEYHQPASLRDEGRIPLNIV